MSPLLMCLVLIAQDKPVSYHNDVVPILKRSCMGCHNPLKKKGELDLTTYATFKAGGESKAPFMPGDPETSLIIKQVSGQEPEMPMKGDALTKEEVALIGRWIREGAKDDTPAAPAKPVKRDPPVYPSPPVLSAVAFSPDGMLLAVSGYHEVLLHKADGSGLVARLVGASPRIESLAFSADGKRLAVAGGSPSQFGEIQIWDVEARAALSAFKISHDVLYGVSLSADASLVAFGGADKRVRVISAADGKELMRFDGHTNWVFGTTFTKDGKRLLSGSRDRAMKMIDLSNGRHIDDINKLIEPVLCIARHPKEDQVAYGGELGTPRIYKIADNQKRTAANNDTNLVRAFERQPGPVRAIAYSPDGATIAVGSRGAEVRVYAVKDGKRVATLGGHEGPVFAVAYHPDGKRICTAGFDGRVRLFEIAGGKLVADFVPVPLKSKK